MKKIGLACAWAVIFGMSAGAALINGIDFNVDSSVDDGADSRWEDLVGATGFDYQLVGSVNHVSVASARAGITHAYDFPGGLTGNTGGGLLRDAGTTTTRSFNSTTPNWSDRDVTIELWFKPDDLSTATSNGEILFEDSGGTGIGFFMNDNLLQFRHARSGTTVVSSDVTGLEGDFIQALGTYDHGSGAMELFVNGVSVGTQTANGGDWAGGDGAAIGTRGQNNTGGIGGGQANTQSFDGQIAIMRVYRDAILSDEEVLDNYNAVVNDLPLSAPLLPGTPIVMDAREDDGGNGTWENTGHRAPSFNGTLSGETFVGAVANSGLAVPISAYDFSGSSSGAALGNWDALDESSAAFEVWFRPSDLVGDEVIFETGGTDGVGIFLGDGGFAGFGGLSDSQLTFSVTGNNFGANSAFVSVDLSTYGITELLQVVGVYDRDTDTVELFVNGASVGASTAASPIGAWSGSDGAGLGRLSGTFFGGIGNVGSTPSFSPLSGEIALFRFHDYKLDSSQVSYLYDALTVSAVPEPSTWVVFLVLLAGGVYRVRRRCLGRE